MKWRRLGPYTLQILIDMRSPIRYEWILDLIIIEMREELKVGWKVTIKVDEMVIQDEIQDEMMKEEGEVDGGLSISLS